MQVRARVQVHLENLIGRFPFLADAEIEETPDRDYLFRIFIPREVWVQLSACLADDVTYDNFKNECARAMAMQTRGYTAALHDVWGVMNDVQRKVHGRGLYARPFFPLSATAASTGAVPARAADPQDTGAPSKKKQGKKCKKRKKRKMAKGARARQSTGVSSDSVPIECTDGDLELMPVRDAPVAVLVMDGNTQTAVGIIEHPDHHASHADAYEAAVESHVFRRVAKPQFTLCGWNATLRQQYEQEGIPIY